MPPLQLGLRSDFMLPYLAVGFPAADMDFVEEPGSDVAGLLNSSDVKKRP